MNLNSPKWWQFHDLYNHKIIDVVKQFIKLRNSVCRLCTERLPLNVLNTYCVVKLKFSKLTMACSRPAALLMRGMRGLTKVSEASQISQGLVKHSLNWPLAQCKVKIQGESWNLASSTHCSPGRVHLLHWSSGGQGRPGQCPREISADRAWPGWIEPGNGQLELSAHSSPGGNCHWSVMPGWRDQLKAAVYLLVSDQI